jgi:adenosine/AMP kinase
LTQTLCAPVAVLHSSFVFGNVLHKHVPEVRRIFCATANPVEVVVGQTDFGPGIIGVIAGPALRGVEAEAGVADRTQLLRSIGCKL